MTLTVARVVDPGREAMQRWGVAKERDQAGQALGRAWAQAVGVHVGLRFCRAYMRGIHIYIYI
jgi:hypothetical protein